MGVLTLRDGTRVRVPEGATPDQVAAIFAERNRQIELERIREGARQAYEDSTTTQKFLIGTARPFVELGLGLKDLAGRIGFGKGLSDEDRANLERLEQVTGGAGTAGRIAGELATFALPAGAAGKVGTKAMTMLPKSLARATPAVLDIGATAGMEALKAPTENTSRADRAMGGAFGAGVGQVAGKVLRSTLGGMRPKIEQARRMWDDDIPLTPGQMRGGATRTIEENLGKLPFVGPAVRARQQEAMTAWNQRLLNEAAPEGVTTAGQAGFRQATDQFSAAYERLWQRDIPFNLPDLRSAWKAVADEGRKQLAPEASKEVSETLNRIVRGNLVPALRGKAAIYGKAIEKVDDALRAEATKAARAGAGDIAKFYGAARQQLRWRLPQSIRETLEALDSQYRNFATLRRAGGYTAAQKAGGTFTPAQVLGASRALDRSAGKGATARGQAAMQRQAQEAMEVFGASASPPASMLERLAFSPVGLATRPLYGRMAQNWMRGDNPMQRFVADMYSDSPKMQAMANALRRYARPATFGAAVEE